jgi:glucose/arabinose dehydrogenase
MNKLSGALTACALVMANGAAFAQQAADKAALPAIVAAPRTAEPGMVLPANTELLVSMNDELTTKGIDEGHKFRLTLVRDVMVGDMVVIPKGTPAVGEVTWKTGKGAFGKSGKMEIALRYVDLNGRHIPIEGTYRQEGEGNTAATVAGVIAAGVFAGFITGKSAKIPQGRELKAHTKEALPIAMPASLSTQ